MVTRYTLSIHEIPEKSANNGGEARVSANFDRLLLGTRGGIGPSLHTGPRHEPEPEPRIGVRIKPDLVPKIW